MTVHLNWPLLRLFTELNTFDRFTAIFTKETIFVTSCLLSHTPNHFEEGFTVNILKSGTLYFILFWPLVCFWYSSFFRYLVEWPTCRPWWSGGEKVSCTSRHQCVQLILAYSWARPAILVAGKGRRGMFLFLLFLHCSSFFPVLSFISSTIFSISFLPFSGRQHKMTNMGWRVVKPQHNQDPDQTAPFHSLDQFQPIWQGQTLTKN